MAFNWRKFPWTNLHDLNLDWIIQTVKTLEENLADALARVPTTVDAAITKLLTGSGDLTINKTGDVRISGNSVQLTGGTVVSDGAEQLTMHNPNSNTSVTANYNSGVLTLTNNQNGASGVALYAINTPADGGGDNSDFAANVGYVKGAVNAESDARKSGDAALQTAIDREIIPRLNNISASINGIITETEQVLPSYTNQIPLSTDASGAVLNGTGYESGTLNTNGIVETGNTFVSGFIPVKKGDIIRIKDPSAADFSTEFVFALYNSNKVTGNNIGRYIHTIQASEAYGTVSISGNVLTWDTSSISYYFWNDFAYLRVTTGSANSVVTINQELVETTLPVKSLNPDVRVREENLDFDVGKLLAGQKVVIFGDSIIGMSRDQTSVPAYAAEYTGAEVYNVGFGGCRMAVHPTAGYAAFSMWALADAVASGDYSLQDEQAPNGSDYFPEQLALLKSINFNDVDMIVIHYGTNDFAANVTINNTSDDDDTATLCGALRYSLRKLMTAFPKIRIFVSVPIYRKWDSTGAETYTNSNGKKLIDFCEALAGVASEFNLPVIDGYKALGVNTINDAAFSSDGTHLNQHGRRAFGDLIGGKLISPA